MYKSSVHMWWAKRPGWFAITDAVEKRKRKIFENFEIWKKGGYVQGVFCGSQKNGPDRANQDIWKIFSESGGTYPHIRCVPYTAYIVWPCTASSPRCIIDSTTRGDRGLKPIILLTAEREAKMVSCHQQLKQLAHTHQKRTQKNAVGMWDFFLSNFLGLRQVNLLSRFKTKVLNSSKIILHDIPKRVKSV